MSINYTKPYKLSKVYKARITLESCLKNHSFKSVFIDIMEMGGVHTDGLSEYFYFMDSNMPCLCLYLLHSLKQNHQPFGRV